MFGFGVGDIQIELNKDHYKLGESVEGVIVLKLKKPLKATRLLATVQVTRHTRRRTSIGVGAKSEVRTSNFLDIPVEIDGEREYGATGDAERFPFSVPLPQERPGQEAVDQLPELAKSVLGAAVKMNMGGSTTYSSKVEARLDIPWAVDLTEEAKLQIDIDDVQF